MKMENTHMTHGTGEDSYARTSLIQAISISKVFPAVKDALEGLYSTMTPKCLMVAELGCASGPNTLMLLPEIIDITYNAYTTLDRENIPEINMFLNDLPTNDFNTISASLPVFHEELEKEKGGNVVPYYINATPGSYYKRLFPKDFLHFVHCSNSAHWLSQVPKKLISENGEHINKGNVYIAETSPPEVLLAYQEQYEQDFTSFLRCRAHEIMTGGRMVVNIMATTKSHMPQDYFMPKLINTALKEMASEGLFDEKKLDDFNFAIYPPTEEEVKSIIEGEGSFLVHQITNFTLDWDVPTKALQKFEKSEGFNEIDLDTRAKVTSGPLKSGSECMLAAHFGDDIIEEFNNRVTKIVKEQLKCGNKLESFLQVISLIKK